MPFHYYLLRKQHQKDGENQPEILFPFILHKENGQQVIIIEVKKTYKKQFVNSFFQKKIAIGNSKIEKQQRQ
jgi:hypothetical protein